MFKTRSELIHNLKGFIGKEHVELDFYGFLFETGRLSNSHKINNQSIIQAKLNQVINIYLGSLQEEGFRIRDAIQSVLNLLTKLAKA